MNINTKSRTLAMAAAIAGLGGVLGGAQIVPREYQSLPSVPAGFGYRQKQRPGGKRTAFAKAKHKQKIAQRSRRKNRMKK